MERTMKLHPGYDCRAECKHDPPGEHGVSSDIWVYGVSDGDRAVSLSVLSTDFPQSVDRAALPEILRRPMANALFFHVAAQEGEPCEWLGGDRGKTDSSGLRAEIFWRVNGDDTQREQPEAFWVALEAELPEVVHRDTKPEDG